MMVFLFILLILFLIVVTLSIQIEIKNFYFCSHKQEGRHISPHYEIIAKGKIMNKIPIAKITITTEKLKKLKVEKKIKEIDFTKLEEKAISTPSLRKEIIEKIKKLSIQVKALDFHLQIGTENAALTAILVPVISTVITFFLQKQIKDWKKQTFIVEPLFFNQNIINFKLAGIFEIKLIHIINTIIHNKPKRRVEKHERTSNRGSYDYGYE
jgi:hypothetical protein